MLEFLIDSTKLKKMEKLILNISELSKKVAFVKGNRVINKKNLKQKKISILECGQLTPIIIVEGKEASEQGLILVDCLTGLEVPKNEVENYVVIIEGQHRFTAITELQNEDKEKSTTFAPVDIVVMYALNPKGDTVKKLISELNRTSVVWIGADYVTGAALCNQGNELLDFAKELADKVSTKNKDGLPTGGYPVSTISKLLTFTSALDKKKLVECMDKGTNDLPTADVDRAKQILNAARGVGFTHSYLSHKYFIDWVIDENNKKISIDDICKKINDLKKPKVEAISKINTISYVSEIRAIVDSVSDAE